eukprot:scaffold53304_cov27-Tisochrysis_lutea.AAC.4
MQRTMTACLAARVDGHHVIGRQPTRFEPSERWCRQIGRKALCPHIGNGISDMGATCSTCKRQSSQRLAKG